MNQWSSHLVFLLEEQAIFNPISLRIMLEIFVGDVVYYATPDQTLAKNKIKAICRTKVKGRNKHSYTLCNGLSKLEGDLFLSLKRAKAHFEQYKIEVIIPEGLETD